MIKKLQFKFVAIMLGVLLAVFSIVVITLNVYMQVQSKEQTSHLLATVAAQDGISFMQEPMKSNEPGPAPNGNIGEQEQTKVDPGRNKEVTPEMLRATRFFYAKVDTQGEIIELNVEMISGLEEVDADAYVAEVLSEGTKEGKKENYQYLVAEKDYGKIIVFAERSIERGLLDRLIKTSVMIAIPVILILTLFSLFLAKWAIKPVETAFERQKEFISDASHELKTPLTIIGANADVLEAKIGEQVQLDYIKEQGLRMNRLITDLLELAKLDENRDQMIFEEIPFSKLVQKTALEFDSIAFEAGKILEDQIEPNIVIKGDPGKLKQVITILIDNAIKHSNPQGIIKIGLIERNKQVLFQVTNRGDVLTDLEQERVFERFYRRDDSRSRDTGGSGLGLAIAKGIVDKHKGVITVSSTKEEGTTFEIKFPNI
ncbi:MAG TPA: HAMP domain-containing histidine kinase [Candidatus Dorea intestinavium]|nr:HAMP domain-containing histidine kinase [Candidatus Dorea intestinavium]